MLTALVVERLRAAFPGAFGLLKVEGLLDGAWKTVAFFFVYDFFYYWFHRLQHGSPFLWAQHKLHHSEVSLNATTALRHHWLEDLLRVFFIVLPMSMAFDLKPVGAGFVAFVVGVCGRCSFTRTCGFPSVRWRGWSPDRSFTASIIRSKRTISIATSRRSFRSGISSSAPTTIPAPMNIHAPASRRASG